ncbi:MAG: GCN5 family acetyltransferase [Methylomicrobium sp.]|nr:GCN5 family acetyltransferase [Methylomicrobium sp.]
MSQYPPALEPELVGKYPAMVKSGAGYFFDDVLEYRVWCHPERGASDEFEGEDYYYAFETYEEALCFSGATEGAEEPLVLIRQHEWINEPQPNLYIHEKGERIAEWQVAWLSGSKRLPGAIEEFIRERTNG